MATIDQLHLTTAKQRTSQDYLDILYAIESGATIQKEYAKSTQNKIQYHTERFRTFCIDKLRQPGLVISTATTITYLQSLVDRKCAYSTIETTWDMVKTIARIEGCGDLIDSAKVLGFLSALRRKPVEIYKRKPIASIVDVTSLLLFLWTESSIVFHSNRYRVQLSLFILLTAFTGTRPGAILSGSIYRESLEYEELTLLMEKDMNWTLLVAFHKRKGRRNRGELESPLRDLGDNPVLWPVALTLALAIHDDAVEYQNRFNLAILTGLQVSN